MVTWLIYKAIKKVVGFFVSIISLPFRILYNLVKLGIMLYHAKGVISSYIEFLPSTVILTIGLMVGVAIFYKIIGREG